VDGDTGARRVTVTIDCRQVAQPDRSGRRPAQPHPTCDYLQGVTFAI
jgi:hypothetical protein